MAIHLSNIIKLRYDIWSMSRYGQIATSVEIGIPSMSSIHAVRLPKQRDKA